METGINNKCKAFTSLEQSKKLDEILPKETADFHFKYYSVLEGWCDIPHYRTASHIKDLPCWSLAALLEALPKIHKLKPILDLEENSILYSGTNLDVRADNPVDACVDMILKLKERNLL